MVEIDVVGHYSKAFLYSSLPLTFVNASINPFHYAPALTLVFLELSCILVAHFPGEAAIAMLFIIEVIAFVLIYLVRLMVIRGRLSPFTFTMLPSSIEVAAVNVTVVPLILSVTLWQARSVLSRILVIIMEEIGAVSFSKASLPFSLVSVAVDPSMNAVALSFISLPSTYVIIVLRAVPDSVALLHAFAKHALVRLAVCPAVEPLSICFAAFVFSLVAISACKKLKTLPMPLVLLPCSFVDAS